MWRQQISRLELVSFRSGLAADPHATCGNDPGAAGGAATRVASSRSIAYTASPGIGAVTIGHRGHGRDCDPANEHDTRPHRRDTATSGNPRKEVSEGSGSPSAGAATDVLGSAALPGAGALAALADTLSRALGSAADHAAASASLHQSRGWSATLGYRGRA
jgi:hypothetical protein